MCINVYRCIYNISQKYISRDYFFFVLLVQFLFYTYLVCIFSIFIINTIKFFKSLYYVMLFLMAFWLLLESNHIYLKFLE